MSIRIVVTGASGFLGAAIVRAGRAAGAEVVPVSRRSLPGTVHVRHYAETPPGDVLVHLAEDNDRARVEQAGEQYEVSVRETVDALLAKAYGRVVYASSAALYGHDEVTPRSPAHPVYAADVYGRVKRRAEEGVLSTTAGVSARIANLYGPGMSPANVLSSILRQIPGRGAIQVMDDKPVRDFIWVDDAAAALVAMATGAGVPGIYNVGSGVGFSISALAHLALDLAGEHERGVVATRPSTRASHLVLDITDTILQWHWRPATSLAEGLSRLIEKRQEPSTP